MLLFHQNGLTRTTFKLSTTVGKFVEGNTFLFTHPHDSWGTIPCPKRKKVNSQCNQLVQRIWIIQTKCSFYTMCAKIVTSSRSFSDVHCNAKVANHEELNLDIQIIAQIISSARKKIYYLCDWRLASPFVIIEQKWQVSMINTIIEPVHEISNNEVCATSKASDQPAHTRSLIRAFASRLSFLWLLSYLLNTIWSI